MCSHSLSDNLCEFLIWVRRKLLSFHLQATFFFRNFGRKKRVWEVSEYEIGSLIPFTVHHLGEQTWGNGGGFTLHVKDT